MKKQNQLNKILTAIITREPRVCDSYTILKKQEVKTKHGS